MNNWTFASSPMFEKAWSAIGLDAVAKLQLQQHLSSNPSAGPVMKGSGGLRKLRFALPGGGKSGGVRVLYVLFPAFSRILLADVFAKANQANLSNAEKNEYRKSLRLYEAELRAAAKRLEREEKRNGKP